jgi:hypothetical protein
VNDIHQVRVAHLAAVRARRLLADLEQSRRDSDLGQVMAGLEHEITTVSSTLQELLAEWERSTEAATANTAGVVRSDASATSRRAAEVVAIRTGSQRALILRLLAARRMTDFEIQSELKLSPSSERPRRGELVSFGLVAPTEDTRVHNDQEWTVWTITRLGRSVQDSLDSGEPVVRVHGIAPLSPSTLDTNDEPATLF